MTKIKQFASGSSKFLLSLVGIFILTIGVLAGVLLTQNTSESLDTRSQAAGNCTGSKPSCPDGTKATCICGSDYPRGDCAWECLEIGDGGTGGCPAGTSNQCNPSDPTKCTCCPVGTTLTEANTYTFSFESTYDEGWRNGNVISVWSPNRRYCLGTADLYVSGDGFTNSCALNAPNTGWGTVCTFTNTCRRFVCPAPTATDVPKPTEIPNRPPIGWLDGANCSGIWGWTFDPDTSSTSIAVHLYQGKTFIGAYPTDWNRADVNKAYGITGIHGFYFATPDKFKTGTSESVNVYGIDSARGPNTLLSGAPKTINCPAPLGSIGNWVWLDSNKNGIQDTGEKGMANVVLNLYATNLGTGGSIIGGKNLIGTTTTDLNGFYQFGKLIDGTYSIQIRPPAGYNFTIPNATTAASGTKFDLIDSDADATGYIENIMIKGGYYLDYWDAGLVPQVISCTNKLDISLIIDRSGTMTSTESDNRTKLTWAKEAAVTLMNVLKSEPDIKNYVRISVDSFGSQGNANDPIYGKLTQAAEYKSTLNIGLTNMYDSVINALNNIKYVKPGTCIQCGIVIASKQLTGTDKKVAVLLSDGMANHTWTGTANWINGVTNVQAAINAANAGRKLGITYKAIGYGIKPNKINESALIAIAGGASNYQYKPNPKEWSAAFLEIIKQMCNGQVPVEH